MSKLYKSYLSLKIKDCSKLYLFKSGIFYIFLDEDARIVSPILNLKLTNLNSTTVKCGFPANSLEKNLIKLQNSGYQVDIVDNFNFEHSENSYRYIYCNTCQHILEDFLSINVDDLSISQAFDLLYKLQ